MNYLRKNGNSAADYLLARQQEDGSILYAKNNDATRVWVTADATTALAGEPLPIAAPPREQDQNNSNGTGGSTPGTGGGPLPEAPRPAVPTCRPGPWLRPRTGAARPLATTPVRATTATATAGNTGAGKRQRGDDDTVTPRRPRRFPTRASRWCRWLRPTRYSPRPKRVPSPRRSSRS